MQVRLIYIFNYFSKILDLWQQMLTYLFDLGSNILCKIVNTKKAIIFDERSVFLEAFSNH